MRASRLGTLTLAVLGASTLAGALLGDRVLAGGSRLNDHLRIYTSILGAIEEEYGDEVKSDRLVSSSIREMLRTLDPHSNFLEVKEYSTLQERQRGSYYGLGITVQAVRQHHGRGSLRGDPGPPPGDPRGARHQQDRG